MAKKKSKAPSGLKITRNNNVFTCSWKRGDKYKAQTFQYSINGGTWVTASVAA